VRAEFTVLNTYFLSFRIFEQLALALKNRVTLKLLTVLNVHFSSLRIVSNLRLACKTGLALKIFTVLKYFLLFMIFEQLALVCTKIFHSIEYTFHIQDF